MKATHKLLVAALAVAGLVITMDAEAQNRGSGRTGGNWSGGSHSGGNWSHGGGGRYWGGYRGGYYRGSYWGPSFGLYLGAPLVAGGWGWPYYGYGGYYPGTAVYQSEYPQAYVEQPGELMPSTEVPMSRGAPTQGPLYMNYCESAKAYFPKVASCPEGWKLATPAR